MGAFRTDGAELARLISETMARRLVFIRITVEDALNAYSVFETLNARGPELTATDLLRSYIFQRVFSADREAMLRRWRAIAATVGQAHVPELLRYHVLCEVPQVRRRRLFKLVRDRYTSAADVYGPARGAGIAGPSCSRRSRTPRMGTGWTRRRPSRTSWSWACFA